jgi:glycosyltransferase involved in cell wall biosynthesis
VTAASAAPDLPSYPQALALRPVRVATVITRLDGGAGLLALRGAQSIQDSGIEPVIITGSAGRLLDAAASSGIDVTIEPLLREVIAPRSDLRALRRLELILRDHDFEVVHTHCAKAGAVGRVAARRAGVRRIVHTFHGFPFHDFQSAARRQAYVSIERRLGRITDVALCVGTGVAAEAIRRELVAPDRVRTIGVVVDGLDRVRASMSALLPEARRRARAALGLPASATVVGSVGRLTYQKAPEDFVAALRHLSGRRPGGPEVTGVWIGGGELAERVSRQARRHPCVRVILAGERTDVLDVLPAFDVFASSSRYEGLPTAVVEAMICGVPTVATAVNAVPDLVAPGESGLLVPPGRPALLAAAIGHLLDSPATAARIAAAARARVGDRYGLGALRAALIAAYTADVPGGVSLNTTSSRRIAI